MDGITRHPIQGALVSLDHRFSALTAQNGRFSMDIPPGIYTLTALMRGYSPASIRIDLFQDTQVEILLMPG